MQQYADIYLLGKYSTCFGHPSRPSSGVHKTVLAASGTGHTDNIICMIVAASGTDHTDSMICMIVAAIIQIV